MTWSRSVTVEARNSTSSKTSGSGQNVTVVPDCPRFDAPTFCKRPCGTPAVTFPPRSLHGAVLLAIGGAVASDFEHAAGRERVDDGDADTVQTSGDLVAATAELAARVQRGHDDLCRRAPLVLRVLVDGDATAVVDDAHAAVGEQRDVDTRAMTGHRLVDRIVDDLPDEVMEPGRTGRTDVHAGPLADGIETLEHMDVLGGVPVRTHAVDDR